MTNACTAAQLSLFTSSSSSFSFPSPQLPVTCFYLAAPPTPASDRQRQTEMNSSTKSEAFPVASSAQAGEELAWLLMTAVALTHPTHTVCLATSCLSLFTQLEGFVFLGSSLHNRELHVSHSPTHLHQRHLDEATSSLT